MLLLEEKERHVLWRYAAVPSKCSQWTEMQIISMFWEKNNNTTTIYINVMHFSVGCTMGKMHVHDHFQSTGEQAQMLH